MKFSEGIEELEKLKSKGKSVSEAVSFLYFRKIFHIQAVIFISSVYDLSRSVAEKEVYKHPFYKNFLNDENPFTNDFLDENGDKIISTDND